MNDPSELSPLDSKQGSAESKFDTASETSESDVKSSHTKQRIIIYGVLLAFTIFALNDYRLRTSWEQESQVLFSTLTHSKGLPQKESDPVALKMMQQGQGVDSWLEDRGYSLDESRSGFKIKVFSKSSGLRTYWLIVDYHAGGSRENPFLTTLNVTQQSYYFWTPKPAPLENSRGAGGANNDGGGGEGAPSDNATMQGGGTPISGPGMSSGNREGGQRGGNGQRRNFNPEDRFKELDTNGDETLTDEEFGDRLRDNLERFDSNGDMEVTKQEFMDAMEAILAATRASRAGNNGGEGGAGGPNGPGQSGGSGEGGGLFDVPDDPGETGDEDPNRLPESKAVTP